MESISRLMPAIVTEEHAQAAAKVRRMLSTWARSEDLVRIGAYKAGTDEALDRAIRFRPAIRQFLAQRSGERETFADARTQVLRLAAAIDAGGAA
jgi:flagellum-specific ATP synthase